MFYLFFFLGTGLIIGSFLNVVFIRTEREESYVGGRSHCDSCQHVLHWYDNIPLLSYAILGGKCRYCKVTIPRQHLWFEIGTGLIFSLIGYLFFDPVISSTWLTTLWLLIFVSFLILIVASDLFSMEIPLIFLIGINVVTALYLIVYAVFFERQIPFMETSFWDAVLGGGIAWLFFFLLVYLSHETWMGWGDVWIALVGGLAVGLKLTLPMLTLSFALGALFGTGLLLFRKKNLETQVPFAPFLALGILCILILNQSFPALFQFLIW